MTARTHTLNLPGIRSKSAPRRRRIPVYLRTGRLLHIFTIAELTLLAAAVPGLQPFGAGSIMAVVWKTLILAFLTSLPILSQLDARSRFQNYKRARDQFLQFGFDNRLLKPFLKSRCQRDAVWVAADELGHGTLCGDYYRYRGYRWYHILPDFVFSHPRFLVSRRFWQSTFFLQTYQPRNERRK